MKRSEKLSEFIDAYIKSTETPFLCPYYNRHYVKNIKSNISEDFPELKNLRTEYGSVYWFPVYKDNGIIDQKLTKNIRIEKLYEALEIITKNEKI